MNTSAVLYTVAMIDTEVAALETELVFDRRAREYVRELGKRNKALQSVSILDQSVLVLCKV
jgi:hypothetical protein